MVTVIWNITGFHVIDFLPQGASFNSTYFIDHILTPLFNIKENIWSEAGSRRMWLHLDNCKVHNSKLSSEKIEEYGFKRAPHPPYSPDIAPSDSFLFGYAKTKLRGHYFESIDELIEAIIQIFHGISEEKKREVFEAWIKRCQYVASHNGDYYQVE